MPKRPDVVMFRGQPWGSGNYRPGPNGHQRDADFPNVRWLDVGGVVHQASAHNNLALCELDKGFYILTHVVVEEATEARITCVACMGYPTWKDYPVE